jgi:hypothetical protein
MWKEIGRPGQGDKVRMTWSLLKIRRRNTAEVSRQAS